MKIIRRAPQAHERYHLVQIKNSEKKSFSHFSGSIYDKRFSFKKLFPL